MEQQWEYTRKPNPSDDLLNALGQANWELVAIESSGRYVFKRLRRTSVRIGG